MAGRGIPVPGRRSPPAGRAWRKTVKKPSRKPPNPAAKALADPLFKQRVTKSPELYTRRRKYKPGPDEELPLNAAADRPGLETIREQQERKPPED